MESLVLQLKAVLNDQELFFKKYSVQERITSQAKVLKDLNRKKLLLEHELVRLSQSSPIYENAFRSLKPSQLNSLVEKGLIIQSPKMIIEKLDAKHFEELKNKFFLSENLDRLILDLVKGTVSYSFVPKTLKSKRKGDRTELVIDTKYCLNKDVMKKYVRQNFRELAMKYFPSAYDRNTFNVVYEKHIVHSNELGSVYLALNEILIATKTKIENNFRNNQTTTKVDFVIQNLNLLELKRPILKEILYR